MADNKTVNPGLLNPLDEDAVVSPGEITGGDNIIINACPHKKDAYDALNLDGEFVGLVQGISFQSGRSVRAIYEVGKPRPFLTSSKGGKQLSISAIISEDANVITSMYKYMIKNREALYSEGWITESTKGVLAKYASSNMVEGMATDLLRIPFGLEITFLSGSGDVLQTVYLEDCMMASNASSVSAGTRGIGEETSVPWQKSIYYNTGSEE